jgi:hypothetical protein
MFDEKDPPKLMFHKETGLLIVGGTEYQTEVVDNLVRRIRDDLQRRWSEERTTKKQSAEQQRRVQMARTELQIAEKELALAEEQYKRTTVRVEGGFSSKEEAGQALINVERARAMLERRKIELDAANESAEGPGSAARVVVYDVADLFRATPELLTLAQLVLENRGGSVTVQEAKDGKPSKFVVTGSDQAQEAMRKLLDGVRKSTK